MSPYKPCPLRQGMIFSYSGDDVAPAGRVYNHSGPVVVVVKCQAPCATTEDLWADPRHADPVHQVPTLVECVSVGAVILPLNPVAVDVTRIGNIAWARKMSSI